MKTSDSKLMHLDSAQLLRLKDPRGATLSCVEGAVWITYDGDRNDIVLEPGGSCRLARKGATVQPLPSARIVLMAPACQPARRWARAIGVFRPA